MKKEKISLLKNIRFETELLESLGWDESQLKALFLYLETAMNDNYSYTEISSKIKEDFGEATFNIISKIFNEQAFLLPLYRKNKNEN